MCKTQLHKHEPLFRKWPPPSGLVPGLASQCYTGLGEEWTPEASLGQSDSQILSKKNLEWKARDVSISISAWIKRTFKRRAVDVLHAGLGEAETERAAGVGGGEQSLWGMGQKPSRSRIHGLQLWSSSFWREAPAILHFITCVSMTYVFSYNQCSSAECISIPWALAEIPVVCSLVSRA